MFTRRRYAVAHGGCLSRGAHCPACQVHPGPGEEVSHAQQGRTFSWINGLVGNFTGNPHVSWEDQWFPVKIVPLNQSIDWRNSMGKALFSERAGKSRNLREDIGAKLGKTGGIQDSARVQDWSELGITKS